jgi:hypothetical protein
VVVCSGSHEKKVNLGEVIPAQAYPFILAVESEEDYAALIGGGVIRLRHPKRPA